MPFGKKEKYTLKNRRYEDEDDSGPEDVTNNEVFRLRQELREKETDFQSKLSQLQQENHRLKDELEILKNEKENLDLTQDKLLNEIDELKIKIGGNKKTKLSPVRPGRQVSKISAVKTPKTEEQHKFLTEAIINNQLLKKLNSAQIASMVDYMKPKTYPENSFPIKEGTTGDHFYALQKGTCEVFQSGKSLNVTLNPGDSFGELAILYNCKRTATIKATSAITVWYLENKVFRYVTQDAIKKELLETSQFLRGISFLKDLTKEALNKIVGRLKSESYNKNDYIVTQGEVGKKFYIIKEGTVTVTITKNGEEKKIRELKAKEGFGEKALQDGNDIRTANIIAKSNTVRVFTLDKTAFVEIFDKGLTIVHGQDIKTPEIPTVPRGTVTIERIVTDQRFENLKLERDFGFIAVLGAGGFGRVELVQMLHTEETFALKCMKKIHIVETRQQEHIIAEREIMMRSDSPFIVKLYRTFKNSRYVYMLLEPCLGGELWTRLRNEGHFPESRARFYAACVVEGLAYLHRKNIVYRDLKPENLLLDNRGYIKFVDFGFAKKLNPGDRTWTFCGTPEYVAPEIILNHGHDIATDYWALGILIYELLTGNPPFNSTDAMRTYRMILRGIDAIDMPLRIKKNPKNLIKRLCRENPSERLGNLAQGINEIRKHPWFSAINWNHLVARSIVPEFIPIINHEGDVGNFDPFDRDNDSSDVPVEASGWDNDF